MIKVNMKIFFSSSSSLFFFFLGGGGIFPLEGLFLLLSQLTFSERSGALFPWFYNEKVINRLFPLIRAS